MKKIVWIALMILAIVPAGYAGSAGPRAESEHDPVMLVPIGDVDIGILTRLAKNAGPILDRGFIIGRRLPDPKYAYNASRGRYYSTVILKVMKREFEESGYKTVLGVIDRDILAEGLNFVFGEADGMYAVISVTRLREEFYGLPSNEELFEMRVLKEAVHELGHTFGLEHCGDPRCVMYFSNTLGESDQKSWKFCEICERLSH
ncbi:MAG: archaemetzincin family Zn-dependent metalloprotease [Candidatus Omnitrophota bacterium]